MNMNAKLETFFVLFLLFFSAMLLSVFAMDEAARRAAGLPLNDPQYRDIAEPTNLPPSVPPAYNRDGTYYYWGEKFTTKAYQMEAFKLVLKEANEIAAELDLSEQLPITESNLTERYIVRYGASRIGFKPIGMISTTNYIYCVSVDHKLSYVEDNHQDQDALIWRAKYKWPLSRVDTSTPYQLATQWLSAISMDVRGLNRDCEVHITPDRYWNNQKSNVKTFVPIYEIYWLSENNKAMHYGDAASVKLFLPTKTLISLRVEDPKYILRSPITFTNLAELLSDTNRSIPIHFPMPHPLLDNQTNSNPN
jgi:hypothetical protein